MADGGSAGAAQRRERARRFLIFQISPTRRSPIPPILSTALLGPLPGVPQIRSFSENSAHTGVGPIFRICDHSLPFLSEFQTHGRG